MLFITTPAIILIIRIRAKKLHPPSSPPRLESHATRPRALARRQIWVDCKGEIGLFLPSRKSPVSRLAVGPRFLVLVDLVSRFSHEIGGLERVVLPTLGTKRFALHRGLEHVRVRLDGDDRRDRLRALHSVGVQDESAAEDAPAE
eukprot:scaffold11488_cov109-Isochrysis_galbana.AAC.6